MKKIGFIIVCLLCALTASALSYASPYKGSGRSGIYTTSSAQMHSFGSMGGSMAQAPVASMHSTSRGITSTAASASVTVPQVACIRTTASSIQGGVTTYDVPRSRVRKATHPGECPGCVDVDPKDGICDICNCEMLACECDDPCHCNVPLDFNAAVALLMALLAGAYAFCKNRKKESI